MEVSVKTKRTHTHTTVGTSTLVRDEVFTAMKILLIYDAA